jgi:hypothetical protein
MAEAAIVVRVTIDLCLPLSERVEAADVGVGEWALPAATW